MHDRDRTRRRAHELWGQGERPEGRDREHWGRACREIEAGDGVVTSGQPDPFPQVTAPDGGGATSAQAAAAAATPRTAEAGLA